MKRTGLLKRKTRLRRLGARHLRDRAAVAKFRVAILDRAQGRCECCGRASRALDPHHIVGRGRAPGWARLHDPELNGMAACRRCHDKLNDRPELAGERYVRAMQTWIRDRRSA